MGDCKKSTKYFDIHKIDFNKNICIIIQAREYGKMKAINKARGSIKKSDDIIITVKGESNENTSRNH